jgi:hypothetical protein
MCDSRFRSVRPSRYRAAIPARLFFLTSVGDDSRRVARGFASFGFTVVT